MLTNTSPRKLSLVMEGFGTTMDWLLSTLISSQPSKKLGPYIVNRTCRIAKEVGQLPRSMLNCKLVASYDKKPEKKREGTRTCHAPRWPSLARFLLGKTFFESFASKMTNSCCGGVKPLLTVPVSTSTLVTACGKGSGPKIID